VLPPKLYQPLNHLWLKSVGAGHDLDRVSRGHSEYYKVQGEREKQQQDAVERSFYYKVP
jgi:hypothetical protein